MHNRPASLPADPPLALLTLAGATAEWRAGVAPRCLASVRLLDAVDFTVHRGECVVVHHDDPAGVRVLLAALSGHPRLIAGGMWRGARLALPSVRIRRASVRVDLVAPLVAGWGAAGTPERVGLHETTPDGQSVHLLRASRPAATWAPREARAAERDHDAWRAWAREQRRRGGALVIVADTRSGGASGLRDGPSRGSGPPAAQRGVHEGQPRYASSGADVRECILRNGRLLSPARTVSQERPMDRDVDRYVDRYVDPYVDQRCWPSEAPLVVGP